MSFTGKVKKLDNLALITLYVGAIKVILVCYKKHIRYNYTSKSYSTKKFAVTH